MKKYIAMALALMLILSCFAGCSAEPATDSEYVKKNGKLVVGITDYAPMDFKDENGQWTGFDAEFAKLFAKELNTSPFRHLTKLRMEKASLLIFEKRPLKEVAESVGYSDVFQFSRAYKRYFGYPPSKSQ